MEERWGCESGLASRFGAEEEEPTKCGGDFLFRPLVPLLISCGGVSMGAERRGETEGIVANIM